MKYLYLLATAASALCASTEVAAQSTITRTFSVTGIGDGQPFAGPITMTFGFTYDPTAYSFYNLAVNYYTASSTYPAFNLTPVKFSKVDNNFYVGGRDLGFEPNTPDFSISFLQNAQGVVAPNAVNVTYSTGDGFARVLTQPTIIETTGLSAVPEPATWAMMLAGFGMAGYALRRHRDRLTVRFA